MTCSNYPPLLSRFLDGELTPGETAELEGHLTRCEDCRSLKESWQRQSTLLREHLGRHCLGDEFVRKVMRVVPAPPRAITARGDDVRRPRRRWLQAVAAVVLAAVGISIYFSSRNSVGYARVIDPGAMEVLQSSAWVRARVGELLHPGDWLRNSVQRPPEILWKDSCRFTLEAGTLAHIPERQLQMPDEVVLISGSLSSEVQGGRDFHVSTPAGSVASSVGRFTVSVTDHALPQLTVAEDGTETLTGKIVSIGEVRVGDGSAVIRVAQTAHEVPAGTTAVFGNSDFTSSAVHPSVVEASLRVISNAANRGAIHASLDAAGGSLWINVEAANVSLRKVLEWTTAGEVRGGDEIIVTGHLRFPAQAGAESVASAACSALGLPVSYKRERGAKLIAAGRLKPEQPPDAAAGEFTFEKSPDGRISFNFRSVPAGRIFQILRSAVNSLPELSSDTAAMPVSMQASGLSREEAPGWIGKALGLELRMADHEMGVVEIGSPAAIPPQSGVAAPGAQRDPEPQASSVSGLSAEETRPSSNVFPISSERQVLPANSSTTAGTWPQKAAARPLWSIIGPGAAAGFYGPPAGVGGSQSTARGKTSAKKPQFFGAAELIGRTSPSTHLIWPTLGMENDHGAEDAYLVTNPMSLTARSIWRGFDQEGKLVAEYEIPVDGSSTLALLPTRDLPYFLGAGGHWETFSNLALVGSRDSESGDGIGWPSNSERLNRTWAFPSSLLSLGARVWLVNPDREPASVVLVIKKNGAVVATETLCLQPHTGLIWPDAASGPGVGMTILVSVSEGKAATGLK